MTRRSLMRRALLALAAGPALIGCASRRGPSPPVPTVFAPAPKTGPLSVAEIENLVAFGELVVEGETVPLGQRWFLIEYIDDRTKHSAQYLSLYRAAASTLDRLAGRRFTSLEVGERLELIARHGLAGRRVLPGDDLGPLSTEMRTLRARVVPDLIRGYYGSAAGWAVVGYQTFPGRCGDLTRYTRPEG